MNLSRKSLTPPESLREQATAQSSDGGRPPSENGRGHSELSHSKRALPAGFVNVWCVSDRFDRRALPLADRHYNRQKIGSPQFVPPGRCHVLLTGDADALWVTSWPFAEYVRHDWPGAWVNSLFRNESPHLSSSLIRQAVAATVARWPEIPSLGMVTFVDASKTRRKRDPGRCYRKAGFHHVGFTKGGLWALQMLPDDMPEPVPALGSQAELEIAA